MPQSDTPNPAAGVSFGLFTPIVQPINIQAWEDTAGPDELTGVVLAAEELGFDFVTVGDHAALSEDESAYYGSARFFDPVATIGFLAARTRRIRFATHVYQLPLRSPLITAKAFATLDVLSGGRIVVGLGVGRRPYEAQAARVPFAERGAVADEYLQAVLKLWSGQPASQQSRFVEMDGLVCRPRPVQQPRPPVWVGGDRFVGLRRALDLGDAWTPWSLGPDQVGELLQRAADERDGLPPGFRVVVPIAPLGGRAPRGEPAPPRDTPGARAVQACLDLTERWRRAGATDFIVDLPSPSQAALTEAMAWFSSDVLPHTGHTVPPDLAGPPHT
ncbi:TIGR03619 family F420-dependent LLM class oxidoreductase [Streptomyces sp. NPDC051913]|uniref:TIGR03619 family F420-dependent LLM class oxidoreductase n=1 Tax=Streptomyces sp. NPDC051913 TaxID=3365676 RepID=UPI0037D8A673